MICIEAAARKTDSHIQLFKSFNMHKNREEEVNHPPFTAFSQHHNQQADFMVHQPFENIYSSYSNLRRMQSSLSSQSTLQISSQTMTSKTNDSSEGSNSSSSSTIMALSSSSSSIHDAPPTATSSQSNTSGNNNMSGVSRRTSLSVTECSETYKLFRQCSTNSSDTKTISCSHSIANYLRCAMNKCQERRNIEGLKIDRACVYLMIGEIIFCKESSWTDGCMLNVYKERMCF